MDAVCVMKSNGSIDTGEEAKVYVKDFDMFVTVQLLEDTPEVVTSAKLCEENGHSCEWNEGHSAKSYSTWQKQNLADPTHSCLLLLLVYRVRSQQFWFRLRRASQEIGNG